MSTDTGTEGIDTAPFRGVARDWGTAYADGEMRLAAISARSAELLSVVT